VFVTNTKDIIPDIKPDKSELKPDQQKYYLYGNPKFYTSAPKSGKESVPSLIGAEKEVEDIKKILVNNNKASINSIGLPVTEDTIRSLKNPYVLHISTHGFFMESSKEKTEGVNNPMLNSGLMLSGSGSLLDSQEGYINSKQGILTASEVMDLNFSSTNLVVLSACETGRGQIEVGEGVFGLQRAFLVAGAKSIILSLFKVDDDATNLLMVTFYQKFVENGGDYRKAFREAKDFVRKNEKFASPIYWGPFIMVEGKQKRNKIN
jgi:CHAT domain-containing protein